MRYTSDKYLFILLLLSIFVFNYSLSFSQDKDVVVNKDIHNIDSRSYCTAGATTCDEYISRIQVGTIDNSTGCGLISGYSDYTAQSTDMVISTGYGVTVTNGNSWSGDQCGIWIDWNQDEDFDDTDETITVSGGPDTFTGTITPPEGAFTGNTRMRVRICYTSGLDDCGTASYGEVEDYTVNVTSGSYCDPTYTNLCSSGDYIDDFYTENGATNISNLSSGCNGETNNYKYYSGMTVTVAAGGSFDINVQSGGTFGQGYRIWIDYNADGDFNDTGEDVWYSASSGTGLYEGTITVPGGTSAGTKRMRVRCAYSCVPTVAQDCGAACSTYGETEDYNVEVTAGSGMTYSSGTVVQDETSDTEKGTTNQEIIEIRVVTTGSSSPIDATKFTFSIGGTPGTDNSTDIENAKVWYTGTSSAFATTSQFGSTYATPPASPTAFDISGTQELSEGTNYFWLTYDIKPGATAGNKVDASCTVITVDGSNETPSTTDPSGSRTIIASAGPSYCAAGATYCDEYIARVQFVTIDNSTGCGLVDGYSDYTAQAANVDIGTGYGITVTNGSTVYSSDQCGIWVDWNQDGDFEDTDETITITGTPGVGPYTATITPPGGATQGNTRMRVRICYTSGLDPCGTSSYGEVEDYTLNVTSGAASMLYTTSSVIQTETSDVDVGATGQEIIGMQIMTSGTEDPIDVTKFRFTTGGTPGTDDIGDILNAKVWYTGTSSTFAMTSQFGSTYATPPADPTNMDITGTQQLAEGTNYFWLTYDIASDATASNEVDAKCTLITVDSSDETPTTTDPSGSRTIAAPPDMAYTSSTTTQTNTNDVEVNTISREIIGIQIVTTNSANPVSVTEFQVNATGTTDAGDILNAKIWYTGTSSTFATMNQFGSTYATPTTTDFTITGTRELAEGTNYFWLSFDIASDATTGNYVDARCTQITVAGSDETPTTTSPAGNREIITTSNANSLFTINGDAELTEDEDLIILTPDIVDQSGSAWYNYKFDLAEDFNLQFNIYLGDKADLKAEGADGICFAFQNECSSAGGSGAGMGCEGITPSLVIEYDTYCNDAFPYYDPDPERYDHIDIHEDGSLNHTTSLTTGPVPLKTAANYDVEDDAWHTSEIDWDASTTTLTVYFDGVLRQSITKDIVTDIFDGKPNVYWGFSAGTGLYYNEQKVQITSFPATTSQLEDQSISQGGSFQVEVASGASSYIWSPNEGIDDNTIYNPTLSPEATTEYSVTITDACGNTTVDNIIITVSPLPIELVEFTANPVNDFVELSWTTATEENNDYFTVERSKDADMFKELAKVDGAGNSSYTITYFELDTSPYRGVSYYRLKQTDFDGKYDYSDIVSVFFCKKTTPLTFNVFPNPASDNSDVYMSIEGLEPGEEVLVVVRDIMGNELYSKVIFTNYSGSALEAVDPYSMLPAGIYLIIGTTKDEIFQKKLIIR